MATERQKTIKNLDTQFSRFIRMRDSDENGMVACFTCGVVKHWKKGDAGHFQSRGKLSTRWEETNVQFQCKRCNGFRGGEQYKFAQELDAKYGDGTADALVFESNQMRKYGHYELALMLRGYSRKSKELELQKGLG